MAEITLLVCDACKRRDRTTEATETLRVTVEGQALRIDVCEEHSGEFRRVLDTLAAVGSPEVILPGGRSVSGRRGPKPRADLLQSPGARGCPVCFRLISSQGNRNHHIRKQHLRKPDEWSPDELEAATREARRRMATPEVEPPAVGTT